jgi:hypothetical protein
MESCIFYLTTCFIRSDMGSHAPSTCQSAAKRSYQFTTSASPQILCRRVPGVAHIKVHVVSASLAYRNHPLTSKTLWTLNEIQSIKSNVSPDPTSAG